MLTIKQLLNKSRKKQIKNKKTPALQNSPQKRGICLNAFSRNPKKPNSANRKVAKILLSNKREIVAFVSGEGENITKQSIVLIRGGRVKDLPGIKYKIIPGVLNASGIKNRKSSRSKYGTKLFKT